MKLSWLKALGGFFLAAALSAPAMGTNTALPGTLNFIEGQASIGTQTLSSKSAGSADLEPGQTLTTQNGRAEVLLTPGVFLRLDRNSAVKMISPSLTNTEVQVDRGRAQIEVAELHKQNDLQVRQDDVVTTLTKTGLYEFTSDPDTVRVFKGEAQVVDGERSVKVKGGHVLALNASNAKAEKFDKDQAKDDFYNWGSLRSQYMSEASADAAQIYVNNGWIGPGWYWDPGFFGYTYLPGSGFLYSPFGWGFYSPGFIYSPGFYGYGRPIYRGYYHPHYIGPRGGFHGGGFHAGGFHGGGHVGGGHR